MKTLKYLIPILTAATLACAASGQTATAAVQTPVASVSASTGDAPQNLSYGVTQVLKLQQGGLGKDVLVNYVNNAHASFTLRADDIVYLHNAGVPEEVITAMMDKERNHTTIAENTAPVQQQSVQQQQPQNTMVNPPAPTTTTVVTQPPVVYTSPTYVYSDPYPYYYGYSRPYYYGPPVSLSFGFGWGGGGHWGGHGGWAGHGGWGGGHHH